MPKLRNNLIKHGNNSGSSVTFEITLFAKYLKDKVERKYEKFRPHLRDKFWPENLIK